MATKTVSLLVSQPPRAEMSLPRVGSFFCTSLILCAVGISYLVKLDYQSIHHGELIHAWEVAGSKNSYYIMEEFRYGEYKNHTCLIKRRTGRSKKESEKLAKKKKRGTKRKIWLYKEGHCSDAKLRNYYLRSGIGYMCPFPLALCCLFVFCFFESREMSSTSPRPSRVAVPQTEPPKGTEVSSNELEIEMPESA